MSDPLPVSIPQGGERRYCWPTFLFFSFTLLLAGAGSYLMADYLREVGWIGSSTTLWFLFSILFGYLAFGFSHAFFGFFLRRLRLPFARMPSPAMLESTTSSETKARVAIIIPIYNEPVERVFAGVAAIFDSVGRTSEEEIFDLFILSDSDHPEQWISEEAAWLKLIQNTHAQGRVFYRRRPDNAAQKSGNVADFCRTWGDHYRYLLVLDADSIMTGETLLELYRRMEAYPRVALIQTSPRLVNAESLFGRMQQFSNRLYGPVFMEGLAYWQQQGGNFWGHNAIIRLQPFMEHCDLPELPGEKPFGGQILSHDFVEAGLLRRAGWEVWFASDLGGSYEEGPQGIIESALRDRRWCQGNLQHSLLLFARGLRRKTRIHLANGILCYLSSPLWLLFLMVTVWRAYVVGIDSFVASESSHTKGLILLFFTATLLFGPKLLCLLDLVIDRKRLRSFGGFYNVTLGTLAEVALSTLIAPIMMVFHTKFVIWNLLGKTVDWSPQRRGAQRTSWREAITAHGLHTLAGIALGIFIALSNLPLLLWLSPVLAGLCLSIPLSVWTSQLSTGSSREKKRRLFLTPEESSPIREVIEATQLPKLSPQSPFQPLGAVVLDPILNAAHLALLHRNQHRLLTGRDVYDQCADSLPPNSEATAQAHQLAERLLSEGPKSLDPAETLTLLSDHKSMNWIHREVWRRPKHSLDSWWQQAIRERSATC